MEFDFPPMRICLVFGPDCPPITSKPAAAAFLSFSFSSLLCRTLRESGIRFAYNLDRKNRSEGMADPKKG